MLKEPPFGVQAASAKEENVTLNEVARGRECKKRNEGSRDISNLAFLRGTSLTCHGLEDAPHEALALEASH
jgi:hypothetical protein